MDSFSFSHDFFLHISLNHQQQEAKRRRHLEAFPVFRLSNGNRYQTAHEDSGRNQ